MIKILLLVLLLLFEAEGFKIENRYDTAHQKALKSDKILMVYLTKKNCPACNKELIKIMSNKKIASLIEKDAVFVVVYQKQQESYPIEMLYTTYYPALFFLDKYELFSCEALQRNIKPQEIINCLKQR